MKIVHEIIAFNQKAWIKSFIDINTELRKKKSNFEKDFFKQINNTAFRETVENVRKHRDVKLAKFGQMVCQFGQMVECSFKN